MKKAIVFILLVLGTLVTLAAFSQDSTSIVTTMLANGDPLWLYVWGAIGVCMHWIIKLWDCNTKAESFEQAWNLFNWKKQTIIAAFSIAFMMVLIALRTDVIKMLDIEMEIGKLLCFFFGYFADSLIKNLLKEGAKKVKVDPE